MKVCYFHLWVYPCPYKGRWTPLFHCWRAPRIKAKATKKRTRNNLANVWHVPKSGVQVDDLLHPHDDYQCWPVKQWLPLCSPCSVIKHIVSKKAFQRNGKCCEDQENSKIRRILLWQTFLFMLSQELNGCQSLQEAAQKNCRLLMMTQRLDKTYFALFGDYTFCPKICMQCTLRSNGWYV